MEVTINYAAVLVAVVANAIVGSLWYSPILFGKAWMKMVGLDPSKTPEGAGKSMGISIALSALTAYVMAHFIDLLSIANLTMAYQFVFWSWLGFILPVTANEYLFNARTKPWTLYWLNNGNILVSWLVMISVLVLWN